MSTRKRSRSSNSYYSNSNSNSNSNSSNGKSFVTRVFETPKKSKKRMIEVRMSIDDYNSYKDYKKYMKENNIDIPSGQSEYSQRLVNLDIEHKNLIQSYKILEKSYKDLIKNCLEEKKVNKYARKISKSTKKKGNQNGNRNRQLIKGPEENTNALFFNLSNIHLGETNA